MDAERVLDAVEARLVDEPAAPSRNRKPLVGPAPAFDHLDPIWELRVGEWRVFYDVDEEQRVVTVRAVKHKGRKTTKEIL